MPYKYTISTLEGKEIHAFLEKLAEDIDKGIAQKNILASRRARVALSCLRRTGPILRRALLAYMSGDKKNGNIELGTFIIEFRRKMR